MIVITGASRGIGLAIGKHLTRVGKRVLGVARTGSQGESFPIVSLDVCDDEQITQLVRNLRSEDHKIEALVNAAGIAKMNLALMTPSSTTKTILDTNLLGTMAMCRQIAPLMIRGGSGSIVNFSTIAVSLSLEGESSYVASKAAVEAYSRVLAKELSAHQIRVNCIAPGPIQTELLRGVSESQISRIVNRQIIKRQFRADEVAELVELILDNRAKCLTGQTISVGGV